MNLDTIRSFYDGFVAQQVKSGVNPRVAGLYRRMIKAGLTTDSRVLELGCGVGMLTRLLCAFVKHGTIEAVDLSENSIRYAVDHFECSNVNYAVGDVVTYLPQMNSPDFITLFDIIEHIPLERHDQLFRNVSAIANDRTSILINIPSPASISFDREHNPEALQIVDQEIHLSFLLAVIERNGLQIMRFDTYTIWVENDYQFIEVVKKVPYTGEPVKRSSLEKLKNKINLIRYR